MAQSFLDKIGLRYPVFQAPTGSIAGPELAAAVSSAGAMGAMALTWADPEAARQAVLEVKAATDKPFQVNFALVSPPRSLSDVLDAGAPCVIFSWGDPAPYVDAVRSARALLGIQVTNAIGARRARDLGPDFLICQGIEAGGHVQSTTPLNDLLPQILEAAGELPVVASGGIGDGAGIAAVLALGAAGAMLGTRFVATRESRAHPEYKQLLTEADASDSALTVCFDGDWPYAPHRVLRNATLNNWEAGGCAPRGDRPGEGEVVAWSAAGAAIQRYDDTAPRGGMTGQVAEMALYAGQSVGAIGDIPSAVDLVPRLWAECEAVR